MFLVRAKTILTNPKSNVVTLQAIMLKDIEVALKPEDAGDLQKLKTVLTEKTGLQNLEFSILRKSIDARGKSPVIRVKCRVSNTPLHIDTHVDFEAVRYQDVSNAKQVIIAGAGPAGYFAALKLIENGIKPIVLERGKAVKERRKDISKLHTKHMVHPDSNYCFGEGGAGTFSDGKLYTRSTKRGDLKRILSIFVSHGASKEIMIDAHPHIGTNKLPKIVSAMRETIERCGGEVRFNTRITDFIIEENSIKGVKTATGDHLNAKHIILATGHSARDIFERLHKKNVLIEAKPFAIGVRVEHPQRLIDSLQYNCGHDRGRDLPAASYGLVHEVRNKGVYSFCMCPGGQIVPSATAPGEVVMNGMSTSTRSSRFANSGIVVQVDEKDIPGFNSSGPLKFMRFQQHIEKKMCALAGNDQTAPGQRLLDFVNNTLSPELNKSSYIPGVVSKPLHEALPKFIRARLQDAFREFDKKMKGYLTNDAQILATESRTSSPVRIPRDLKTCEHPQIKGLFPCGEGAGYAGGIVSAAMDGERVAQAVAERLRV